MTRKILALAALLIASPAFAQHVEHAPTVEQCQADQRLWLSRLEDEKDELKDVNFMSLLVWGHEMKVCEQVDPPQRARYDQPWVRLHRHNS